MPISIEPAQTTEIDRRLSSRVETMEQFLVSVSAGAMRSVLAKLAALLVGRYNLDKEVRRDIESMEEELVAMHAFLEDMSRMNDDGHDQRTKLRIMAVRELSYDIEDSVDKFMLLDHKSSRPGGLRRLVSQCKNRISEIKTCHQVAGEIHDIKMRIGEAADRHLRYSNEVGTSSTIAGNSKVDPRVCNLFKDASQLVGLDVPKNHVIQLLMTKGDALSTEHKVVSIVGPGGLGKTTLAKKVYDELKSSFDCCGFVSVSQTPDIMRVLREMLNQASCQNYASTEAGSAQQLVTNIVGFLSDKKYLFVVDDIWDMSTLEIIKSALPYNSNGSRVIATTRKQSLAQLCCPSNGDHIYRMEPLSGADSRSLFLRKIFGRTERCPTHLEDATAKILRRCGGIPLAVITVASLLARKPITDNNWTKVGNYIGSAAGNSTEIDAMRKILSLSYFDLPCHLRTCLLYLSIFPEDYIIKKDDLICAWIAEGFIQEDGDGVQVVGENYLYELINRSLIQPWDTYEYTDCEPWHRYEETGETSFCRVHDVILGFIVSKAAEENFVTLCGAPVPQNKIRRLYVQHHDQTCVTEWNKHTLHHIRSLIVFESAREIPSLSKFKFLRLLDLRHERLENKNLLNIGKLFYLKYLCLKHTCIDVLPEVLGELQYLETLDVSDCPRLGELPSTVTRLRRLVRLIVPEQIKLPEHIGKFKNLEELKGIVIFWCGLNENVIPELATLKKLRVLGIGLHGSYCKSSCDIRKHEEKLVTCLCKLGTWNLRSLSLHLAYLRNNAESWRFNAHKLQELEMSYRTLYSVPRWMGSLHKLEKLVVGLSEFRQQDIDTIADIPGLIFLSITSEGTKERIIISGGRHFECLKSFHLYARGYPVGLWFEDGAMPMLMNLRLVFEASDTKEKYGGFDFGIQNLRRLAVINVTPTSKYIRLNKVDDNLVAVAKYFNELPSHPLININMRYGWKDLEKDEDNSLEKSNKRHKSCHN